MRKSPPRTAIERVRLRVRFDQSEGALPILGDLVRQKRGSFPRKAVGEEAGVPGNAVLDIENHHSAKQEEIDRLMKWVGHTAATCQAPPAINNRVFGRPRLDGESEKHLLDAILVWLSNGHKLSEFESVELQIDTKRAKRLVARHLGKNPEFRAAYLQARQVGAYFMADEVIDIADSTTLSPSQAANMMKARMWAASKANPDIFGQNSKAEVNVNHGFGEALEQLERRRQENALPAPNLRVIDIEPLPLRTDERAAQVATLAED